VKASVGGRLVADGEGDDDEGAGELDDGELDAGAELLAEAVGEGLSDGAAVSTSPPSSRARSPNHPPTRTITSAATARRTQKPRSGSGVPVPGTVCRPTGRRYCLVASRRRNQPTTPTTSDPTMKTPATAYDACFKAGCEAA